MDLRHFKPFKNKYLLGVMLLLLVKPDYFSHLNIWLLNGVYKIGSYCCAFFVICVSLKYLSRKVFAWIYTYFGVMLITTIIGSGHVDILISSQISNLTMCLIFAIWLLKSPETLFDAFYALDFLLIINFVTILVFPNGMYNNGIYNTCWFLGYKNPQIRTILPIICISVLRSYWKFSRLTKYTCFLLACAIFSMIRLNSVTSLIGIGVFILLLFLYHRKRKEIPQILTLINGFIISFVAFLILITASFQSMLSELFSLFNRDITVSNRTIIWMRSLLELKNSPWFGYGFLLPRDYNEIYAGINNVALATHPHNYLLYTAFNGGIVLIIVLVIGYCIANKELVACRNTIQGKIILFCLYAFCAMGITESLTETVLLLPMLILGMYSNTIHITPRVAYDIEGKEKYVKKNS